MESQSGALDNDNWPRNYFNYFTEIEEHFQRARGTGLFLLSPLDWALIESWKNAGVPLDAVLRGIDVAFEKWRAKKSRTQAVNSIAYCAQAIGVEAEAIARGGPQDRAGKGIGSKPSAPFTTGELEGYLRDNAAVLRANAFAELADTLERLAGEAEGLMTDLEDLERRLTGLEEKLLAAARLRQSDEQLLAARRELELQVRPYRSKMTADQLAMLERQFLDRKLLEVSNLPRLSLFYLH